MIKEHHNVLTGWLRTAVSWIGSIWGLRQHCLARKTSCLGIFHLWKLELYGDSEDFRGEDFISWITVFPWFLYLLELFPPAIKQSGEEELQRCHNGNHQDRLCLVSVYCSFGETWLVLLDGETSCCLGIPFLVSRQRKWEMLVSLGCLELCWSDTVPGIFFDVIPSALAFIVFSSDKNLITSFFFFKC